MKSKINYKLTDIAFISFYCIDLIKLVLINILGNNIYAKSIIPTIFVYLILILGIVKEKKKIKVDTILLLMGILILFVASGIVFPENIFAMLELETWNSLECVFTLTGGIFAYAFFRLIDDPKRLYRNLNISSFLLFFWCAIRIVSSLQKGGFNKMNVNGIASVSTYDMTVGYRLLFCSIIFSINYFKLHKNRILNLLMAGISFILMIIYGSRTAVASYILFLVLFSIFCDDFSNKTKKNKFKVIFIFLILVLTYVILFCTDFLKDIYSFLIQHNFNSRILNTLINGSELDIGRTKMWTKSIELIKSNWVIGLGIYSDRTAFNIYCHQILLEIYLDFGIIIGTIIILYLIKNIYTMFFKCKNEYFKMIFIIFFSLSFIRLNLSSSFWQDINFWASIAIYISYRKTERRRIKYGE